MNTEKKVYTLQKDVQHPAYKNTKRGTRFTQNEEGHAYLSADQRVAMSSDMVENNPEWFLLKEEDKKQFEWTDELVKEFVRHTFNRTEHGYLPFAIKEFKDLKESINNVLKEEVPSQQKEFTEPRGNSFGFDKEYEILTYINPNRITDIAGGHIETPNNYSVIRNYHIHSVKRLSDNTTWTVGEETQLGIIKNIEKEADEYPIVFYVGKTNYPLFIYELKKL